VPVIVFCVVMALSRNPDAVAAINDHNFTTWPGLDWGAPFFAYLRDNFDVLAQEDTDVPRLINIDRHCLLVRRPGYF